MGGGEMKKVIEQLNQAAEAIGDIIALYQDNPDDELLDKAYKLIKTAIKSLEAHHRETPEQYRERTGDEWQKDWAVYALVVDWPPMMSYWSGWKILPYGKALEYNHRPGEFKLCIICANNDLGRPPDDWRPEKTMAKMKSLESYYLSARKRNHETKND
jgi:hypothetical protein